jgi:hypothetical protein
VKPFHRVQSFTQALAIAFLAACSGNEVTPPLKPTTSLHPALSREALAEQAGQEELAAAVQGDNWRGIESVILKMENDVPGIGGMYYDTATSRMVIYVKDQSQGAQASGLVRTYLSQARVTQPEAELASNAPVDVRIGQYAFSQLVGWSEILTRDLLKIPNWLSIDADERLNRVSITIADETARQTVNAAVAANGVPVAAVQIAVGPRVYALSTLQDWIARPVGGGVQISNSSLEGCSLGWTVTKPDGTWGFLTAGHCTNYTPGGGQTGDTSYQNFPGQGNALGTVQINPLWNLQCTDPGGVQYPGLCTDADALFVTSTNALLAKKVAETANVGINNQPGSLNLTGWFDVADPGALDLPAVGYYAEKVGRTTGTTKGVIQGTAEKYVICLDQACTSAYLAINQGRITGASAGGGDSGGPIFPLKAHRIGEPPAPLSPWGITVAGTGPPPYCTSSCTLIFTTIPSIRARPGQNFNFGT